MNKNQKIFTYSTLFFGSAVLGAATKWRSYISKIEDRFPELDRKIIQKAYRNFMKNSFLQKYSGIDSYTDEQMDVLFLQEVQKLTSK